MLLRNAVEKEVLKIEVISLLAIFYAFMSSHMLIKLLIVPFCSTACPE